MTRFRTFLCWLLCALLVSAGLPAKRAARCQDGERAMLQVDAAAPHRGQPKRSCCADSHRCCCAPQPTIACGCEQPNPDRAPVPAAPKQPLQRSDAEPLLTPRHVLAPAEPRPVPRTLASMPSRLLPRCSRQEALSVWRC